ncbi:WRKY [Musa troglodytarum]|uniref:WRKY n=1 Tax=Musa troglodytarum TaxID=320322 RepID=A0A9E7JGB6_9LILI|nr:WRKY [Musa troglodytarum]URD79698.1 WRKY [Musa troglodytarum]
MRDYIWQRMENDQGELADVVRAGGWVGDTSTAFPASGWQLPLEPVVFPPASIKDSSSDLGDPFMKLCDPLIDELSGIEFFKSRETMAGQVKMVIKGRDCGDGGDGGRFISQKLVMGGEIKKPFDIISPEGDKSSPLSPVMAGEMMKVSSGAVGCLGDDGGGVQQISSSLQQGVKRRKNEAKKVVCIPAPAAACGRPGGEVVPCDLWAWRKYGQKPIKGSPHPRGYYRCSSSKGCSARKQVERSRIDPNMLVITYTYEHNHPWPTQRNALAGFTRSQTSKNCSIRNLKEEPKETTRSNASSVKQEVKEVVDKANDQAFHRSREPLISEQYHPDNFFTDMSVLEADTINLIFSKELTETKPEENGDKTLDPFNMFY